MFSKLLFYFKEAFGVYFDTLKSGSTIEIYFQGNNDSDWEVGNLSDSVDDEVDSLDVYIFYFFIFWVGKANYIIN